MLRPILPHAAWQAIAAFAGSVTLVFCALAAPVDLWRLSVKSHQGEPFLAIATLASLPDKHISNECLSMGPESDAPGSDMPFLDKADLKLDAAGGAVEISTNEPMTMPALELVLRVQCEGAPLYARHFSALIPPAINRAAPPRPAPKGPPPKPKRAGFHLSLLPGDTVESVAAVLFPAQRGLQQALAQQVIAGNPNVFPGGQPRDISAGTVLWFPDLRELRKSAQAKPSSDASPAANPSGKGAKKTAKASAPAEPTDEATGKTHKPVTLRRALELGDKPGPQECKKLMPLCGAGTPAAAAVTTMPDDKARALESGVKALHLKQEGIEQQLERLEHSLMTLQKTVATAAVPIDTKPKPEIAARKEIIVQTEPISWYIWLSFVGFIVAAALGGFAYGRRRAFTRGLAETDAQLDRMLATTASVIREFESTPRQVAVRQVAAPPLPRPPPLPVPDPEPDHSTTDPAAVRPAPASEYAGVPDIAFDTQAMQPASDVDVHLESETASAGQVAGLSNEVLFEMDQALDNTRSMFTDVDRFIALGRTQNALSLLQFQVHKDPKDRDSWIKLMAIYRQEKMDGELTRAAREFRSNFPNENPPAV